MTNIGSLIFTNIGDLVNTHCYPLIAEQGTTYPFIIYRSSSSAPNSTKDGIYEWQHNVEITIVDEEYDNCCHIVDAVIQRLYAMEDIESVAEIQIDSINEDFMDDAYTKLVSVRIYTHT